MKVISALQYRTACIQLHSNDNIEEVMEFAKEQGAEYEEGPGEYAFVVEFPGRWPELYTERALRNSFPNWMS